MISFILNLPWTILGLIFAILSIPLKFKISSKPFCFVINVKSFRWFFLLRGVRAIVIGNIVLLSPKILEKDFEHELIHIEQYQREPLIHPFLYFLQSLKYGYKNNKYEKEAYERAGNVYLE
ncbi:MAG: hypothetical protein ABL917_00230 [Parcubacteria group bacterium]